MKTLKNILNITLPLVIGFSNCNNEKQEKEEKTPFPKEFTTEGKFERTYRWDKILDEIEEKHQIEKGLLKALGMRESYGDPLRLNESGDGGAGLFMFQPGTAEYCGLQVYGNSNKMGVDKSHGKELKKLIKENKNNFNNYFICNLFHFVNEKFFIFRKGFNNSRRDYFSAIFS